LRKGEWARSGGKLGSEVQRGTFEAWRQDVVSAPADIGSSPSKQAYNDQSSLDVEALETSLLEHHRSTSPPPYQQQAAGEEERLEKSSDSLEQSALSSSSSSSGGGGGAGSVDGSGSIRDEGGSGLDLSSGSESVITQSMVDEAARVPGDGSGDLEMSDLSDVSMRDVLAQLAKVKATLVARQT